MSPLSELRVARRVTVRLSCLDGQLMAKSSGMRSFPLFFPVSVPRTLARNAGFCLRLTSPRIWGKDISRTISQVQDGGMDTIRDIEDSRIRASNEVKVRMLNSPARMTVIPIRRFFPHKVSPLLHRDASELYSRTGANENKASSCSATAGSRC